MNITGSRLIPFPRRLVWECILDPVLMQAVIPGCSELTGSAQDGYLIILERDIGPLDVKLKGDITISNIEPFAGYHIAAKARSRLLGGLGGEADITFRDVPEGCEMGYSVGGGVSGVIGKLGAEVLTGLGRKAVAAFFLRFEAALKRRQSLLEESGPRA